MDSVQSRSASSTSIYWGGRQLYRVEYLLALPQPCQYTGVVVQAVDLLALPHSCLYTGVAVDLLALYHPHLYTGVHSSRFTGSASPTSVYWGTE